MVTENVSWFPQDKDLRKKWVAAVKRENWVPSKWSTLCSTHFREEDVERSLVLVRIKENAVPSIFPVIRPPPKKRPTLKERPKLKRKLHASCKCNPDLVGLDPTKLNKNKRVCQDHFKEDDILPSGRLIQGVIPICYDPLQPSYESAQAGGSRSFSFVKLEDNPSISRETCQSEESDESAPKKKGRGRGRKILDYSLFQTSPETCCALACTNTSESHVLTPLPQDAENRQKWISQIDRQDWTPSETSKLCEIHFEADAWENDAEGVKVLKKGALPTLYLHGEVIKSWVTLDGSGNVENVLLKNTSGNEESIDAKVEKSTSVYIKEELPAVDIDDSIDKDASVYIKQEIMEPDIEMEEPSDFEEPFETLYLNSNIDKTDKRDVISTENIRIKSLTDIESETIVPEITHVNIKTEIMEEGDDTEEYGSETWNCVECCETFDERWTMEQHVLDKHSDSERARSLRKKQNDKSILKNTGKLKSSVGSTPVLKVPLTSSMTNTTTTTGNDISTQHNVTVQAVPSFVTPVVSQGDPSTAQQYLVLIPQPTSSAKHPMYLPLAKSSPTHTVVSPSPPPPSQPQLPSTAPLSPSCTTDSSEIFSISLAQFSEATRVAIKKKLMEVIHTVEKLKVNPEMIVIARKATEIKQKL